MSEDTLHCFGESGNAYKAGLARAGTPTRRGCWG